MTILPDWPARTIGVLSTLGDLPEHGPHAIPVSAPVRAGDSTILLSLHRSRDTLDRLRRRPRVALTFLAEGNVAFTARGDAQVIADPMPEADEYAAVRITVTGVDDHRQPAFSVLAGVARTWIDDGEKQALASRVAALHDLAGDDQAAQV
jgi:hypothetical protein